MNGVVRALCLGLTISRSRIWLHGGAAAYRCGLLSSVCCYFPNGFLGPRCVRCHASLHELLGWLAGYTTFEA